jgi:hypothetical protein
MITDGDVKLFQTVDDGEISIVDGITELTGGFDTALYLSLLGGNVDDDGAEGNPRTWWGNLMESDPARKYVSRTQNILQGLPATSGNMRRVEEAARADLKWFLDVGAATGLEVSVSIPDYGKVLIEGSITVDGEDIPFQYTENWKAAQSEAVGLVGGTDVVPPAPSPGVPDTTFPAPLGLGTQSLARDNAYNLISCTSSGGDLIHIHNGITPDIVQTISAPSASVQGVAFDLDTGNIISYCHTAKKVYVHNGKSGDVIYSFVHPKTNGARDITVINGNLISCDGLSALIYVHDGISATLSGQFSAGQTNPDGLSSDGVNLISTSLTTKKIYKHDGLSGVILDSFDSPDSTFSTGTENNITGDLISCSLSDIFIHSGFNEYAGPLP